MNHNLKTAPSLVLQIFILMTCAPLAQAKDVLVYFGTFTNDISKGVYVSRLDLDSGKCSPPELAIETPSPNFLAVSPKGNVLYAATRVEKFAGNNSGAVSAFAIDRSTGKLARLNQKSSGDIGPCFVSVDAQGKVLFVANFTSGTMKSLPLNRDGSLGDGGTFIRLPGREMETNRPAAFHAHWMAADPSGTFALTCAYNLDEILIHKLDAAHGTLDTNHPSFGTVPTGSSVRHLAFSRNGKFAYAINEIGCTVTRLDWDAAHGKLAERETISALPADVTRQSSFTAAEIVVHPSGKFVYGTVRGHDSISVFVADAKTGKLTLVENIPAGGKTPRGLGVDPTGRWLMTANQASQNIAVFAINPKTGCLTPTGQQLQVGSPVDVKFVK